MGDAGGRITEQVVEPGVHDPQLRQCAGPAPQGRDRADDGIEHDIVAVGLEHPSGGESIELADGFNPSFEESASQILLKDGSSVRVGRSTSGDHRNRAAWRSQHGFRERRGAIRAVVPAHGTAAEVGNRKLGRLFVHARNRLHRQHRNSLRAPAHAVEAEGEAVAEVVHQQRSFGEAAGEGRLELRRWRAVG